MKCILKILCSFFLAETIKIFAHICLFATVIMETKHREKILGAWYPGSV